MIVLVQRVSEAKVYAKGLLQGRIGRGLLLYIAVDRSDVVDGTIQKPGIENLAHKITKLRLFSSSDDSHFKESVMDVGGDVLAVSQFTLPGRTRKGTRPSFDRAAPAELGNEGYSYFCDALRSLGCNVQTGAFGEHMDVHSVGDGPINLLVASPQAETPWL